MELLIFSILLVAALDFWVTLIDSAVFTIPMHRVRMLSKKSDRGVLLLYLRERSEFPITTIISISNIVTVFGSIAIGAVAERTFDGHWIWLIASILTFAMMVPGEIIPKRLGEQYAERIALASAPLLHVLSKVFWPLTAVVRLVVRPFTRQKLPVTSREEISFLAGIGGAEGILKESEGRMIQKVFKLNGITASDMMTPRPFLYMLDGNRTLGEVTAEVMQCPYSKIPVYEKTPEKIIGIVTQHKILKAVADEQPGLQVKDLIEEPLIVPEKRLGDDLLRQFQETRNNFAIVVDGHGHVSGVITLLDVVEELVGEMTDESEIAPQLLKRISKSEIVAHGETQIGRINRFFNVNIPNHRTLCGFLLEEMGGLPKVGDVFRFQGLEFTIEVIDHKSVIEKVHIKKPEQGK